MQTASVVLLANASATGTAQKWPGGRGALNVLGSFGGTTATLEVLGADNATWLSVSSATTKTANGIGTFELPPTQIRCSLTGGAPSAMFARVDRVPG